MPARSPPPALHLRHPPSSPLPLQLRPRPTRHPPPLAPRRLLVPPPHPPLLPPLPTRLPLLNPRPLAPLPRRLNHDRPRPALVRPRRRPRLRHGVRRPSRARRRAHDARRARPDARRRDEGGQVARRTAQGAGRGQARAPPQRGRLRRGSEARALCASSSVERAQQQGIGARELVSLDDDCHDGGCEHEEQGEAARGRAQRRRRDEHVLVERSDGRA